MILPQKHLSLDESLFGFGAYLLGNINKKSNIDVLWRSYMFDYNNNRYSVKFSFDEFILAIVYLYTIGAIEMNKKGDIYYAVNQING